MYKDSCIRRYNHTWDHLAEFMKAKGIESYSREVGDAFLNAWHEGKDYKQLTSRQKERVRHIDVLSDMAESGEVRRSHVMPKEITYPGDVGEPFALFIQEQSRLKAASSLQRYKERIYHLYAYLADSGKTLADFTVRDATAFLEKLDKAKSPVDRDNTVISIRVFLRSMCGKGLLRDNRERLWMEVFRLRRVRSRRLPSVYTKEEVEAVIAAIDRTHPQGKRDYAMVLLAARYGLRISDIIGLRFCNLDWENNRISLVQQKTGRRVTLPLSEEVGGAIIEYIRHGRPQVGLPYVFIKAHAPYGELKASGLGASLGDWMRAAGIDSTGRRHGPHALRHSLATNLLGANQPIPVISEILGHATSESTTVYTRVSVDMLRQCALDVPFVKSSFYDDLYG
jgi:integrase